MVKAYNISEHILVPKHTKLSEEEKETVLKKYNISVTQLPRIFKNDPAIKDMKLKLGDVVKIVRQSPTAGKIVFYRGVTNG
ncbi:MAG: DNA-directed RNA polymerase subunit H [Nanoarchaeota archaeon]|nr:DNA-directed RNA polymerase subunit H [Nanoarchaeota archaeon]